MSRRVLAWFLSVPLIVAGVEGGHWLAYRIVYPDPYVRAQALNDSGHSYLSYLPLFFAIVGAVALCAFGWRVFRRGAADLGTAQVSLLPFLCVSPLAFALQECIERLFVGGWPFAAALAPTFMPGLLFQLPFALVAFLLARWLLRAADRLRVFLCGRGALPAPLLQRVRVRAFPAVDLSRRAALAGGVGERGPPWPFAAASGVS
jgi:hypothetical protein